MFKRITALALALMLAVSLLPAAGAIGREPIVESVDQCCSTLRVDVLDPNYSRPAFNGWLYEITPQRVQDTFDYLDEHYVKNHPEQALMVYTGTAKDKQVLKKLAETITKGCKTNRQKANAIDGWLSRNINYDIGTSAYASDTFYRREGNCLSYANLMMFLLRSLGIPAVVGDGWRGDMKTSTVDLFNMEGHAWCFVRLDGEWVLYDPLWISGGTNDRDYMARNIYFDTVETICPAYDGNNLPPEAYDKPKPYYTDGKFYTWSKALNNTMGNLTLFLNNQTYAYIANQCDGDIGDGICYLDGRDKSGMVRGELYRDGWASYGDYNENSAMHIAYYFPNGMTADGYVKTLDGKDRLLYTNTSNEILTNNYDIIDGYFTLKPGYSGPFLGLSWQEGVMNSSHQFITTWESLNPEIVSVDQNGNITCRREGYADIEVSMKRVENNGNLTHLAGRKLSVLVSNEVRTPDYSDHQASSHNHKYAAQFTVKPTCVRKGYTVYKCLYCTDVYESGSVPISPEAHNWQGTECILCGDTRLTPFNDVREGAYYEAPVAWAVEQGITVGLSSRKFGTHDPCKRSEVVTFLWRTAGKPDPKSSRNPFVDVKKGSYYEKAVLWAVENNITYGTDATHFDPDAPCKRSEVVTFLWRFADEPSASGTIPFTDVPATAWYYKPILWAVKNGITFGTSDTEFGTNDDCSRAQVVTFLYRAFGK